MTHDELQHEIDHLRTQLAICEAKKAARDQKAQESVTAVHQEPKRFSKEYIRSHLPDREQLSHTLNEVAQTVNKELKKNHAVTAAATFVVGVIVGRLISK
ncbi:hypothetical protein [Halodesulfovibrio sp.]|uniref:hypothetical protein n=1 Tax=Halodesulfovibrio sp. TaxID=1912772 RepID=UPI0025C67D8B|nr:hypothetical protein [Halodesulfovibrio sp.]